MPASFDRCVNRGGRVRTMKPKGQRSRTYVRVCYLNGKSYSGGVKKRSVSKRNKKKNK
jgi:hypothetical protein